MGAGPFVKGEKYKVWGYGIEDRSPITVFFFFARYLVVFFLQFFLRPSRAGRFRASALWSDLTMYFVLDRYVT